MLHPVPAQALLPGSLRLSELGSCVDAHHLQRRLQRDSLHEMAIGGGHLDQVREVILAGAMGTQALHSAPQPGERQAVGADVHLGGRRG